MGTFFAGMMLLTMMSTLSIGQTTDKKVEERTPAAKPISALAWLVGGVWKADAAKLGSGMQRIETRYEWADNGAYLHFTTHFVFDNGVLKNYAGNLYWDPEKKALALWYMDAKGSITQGPMEWGGDVLRITFRGPDFEGNVADLKVDVTRKTEDHYHWVVFEKVADSWKELGALEYLRDATKSQL